MVDVHEAPAVPPFDPRGDVRFGYFVAGGLFLALGWGLGVVVNLLLHVLAPAGGIRVGPVLVGSSVGPYAWAVLGFGALTGAFGLVLIALGRESPTGPVVLPGADY